VTFDQDGRNLLTRVARYFTAITSTTWHKSSTRLKAITRNSTKSNVFPAADSAIATALLTITRAKAQKNHLAAAAATTATATAAAAASASSTVFASAGDHNDGDAVGIGDPAKDRRRKVADFARYLGIDPHKDGSLMWIAGDV
jgi:hypothetical protein